MRDPCNKCIVKANCRIKCTAKNKFINIRDILIFFSIFLFITGSNILILKFVMPYVFSQIQNWSLKLLGAMCCYMSIALRALFETLNSIKDYRINYGRKKTTG